LREAAMLGQRLVERLALVEAGHQHVERNPAGGGGGFFHFVAPYRPGMLGAQTIRRKRLMKKLALALVAGLLTPMAMTSAMAQDKTVDLKISIWVPPAHPLVPATKEWAESITKASNGTIKSAIFPSEQLGKAFDHYDMARDGIADVTYVNPGYQ